MDAKRKAETLYAFRCLVKLRFAESKINDIVKTRREKEKQNEKIEKIDRGVHFSEKLSINHHQKRNRQLKWKNSGNVKAGTR